MNIENKKNTKYDDINYRHKSSAAAAVQMFAVDLLMILFFKLVCLKDTHEYQDRMALTKYVWFLRK